MNLQELNALKIKALDAAQSAVDAAGLEAVRIDYLSRKGLLPQVMQELKNVPNEEKPLFGKTVNELKNELTDLIKQKKSEFDAAGSSGGAGCSFGSSGAGSGSSGGAGGGSTLAMGSGASTFGGSAAFGSGVTGAGAGTGGAGTATGWTSGASSGSGESAYFS